MERFASNSFVHLPAAASEQDGMTASPAVEARRIFNDAHFQKFVIRISQGLLWEWGLECLKETSSEFAMNLNNRS